MRITGLRATPVTVPAEAPWRWSMGIETGTTRTIIELETDEGVTGIGETYGGARTRGGARASREPFIVGWIRSRPECSSIAWGSSASATR